MAHPFQQRKLLITVCKAEIGWDESSVLQSGYVTLVAGPFRASTRSVPATRRARAGTSGASAAAGGAGTTGGSGGGGQLLSWAPPLGGELLVLTEDCLLVADLVVGAELWGMRPGGRWGGATEALYAQAEICLDAEGQALLLSGRCLEVRLPLMQPQGQGPGGGGGKGGKGGGGGGGGGRASAGAASAWAPPAPVLGVLALSMLLQPADAGADVARHLPPELLPRLLLDTSRLLPGAVVRGAVGTAYVDPCVVFLRVRLISATGLGRGAKDGPQHHHSRSSTPGHTPQHHQPHAAHGGPGGAGGGDGLPGHLQHLGSKLQSQLGRTMGHVGAFLNRIKEQHASRSRGAAPPPAAAVASAASPPPVLLPADAAAAAAESARRRSVEGLHSHDISGGKEAAASVDHAAAEAVMSLLESNGFAVVDNRRLSNYFWCKVSCEGQYYTSRLVPVSGGAVRWDETFVIAALRPVRNAPLEIELYGSNDSKSRGKVVCQLFVPLCDLMDHVLRNHCQRLDELRSQSSQTSIHDHGQHHRQQQQQQPHGWLEHVAGLPGAKIVKSAVASAAAVAAAAVGGCGAAGGGGGGLPPFHPDSWLRGRAVLTARVGGPGGQASATHGLPAGGGQDGGARECRFQLEVEVVDADARATANATQLLPWARPPQHSRNQDLLAGALAGGGGSEAAGSSTPYGGNGGGGGGVTAMRQGSASNGVGGLAAAAAAAADGGGGSAVLSPPWSPVSRGGGGGVLSLGAVVAACFAHEETPAAAAAPSPPPPPPPSPSPSPPPAGEEDLWLPPPGLPRIRSHVADGAARTAAADGVVLISSPTATEVAGSDLPDTPIATTAAAAASSLPSTAPETGVPCTPVARASSAAATTATAAEAPPPPPPPGLCSTAALAAGACAMLSLVCHDLELERPPPPEAAAAIGGGGVAVGGHAAQHAAAVAAITQGDYFLAIRCGHVWVTTNSLRVVGAGGGGGAAAVSPAAAAASAAAAAGGGGAARLTPHLGFVAPLLKPSTLVSLALFRRTDVVAGKKVLNVRAMIGMMAAEQMVGKLRLRASSLVPGRPVTVCLPLKAERSGPRPCATSAWCRMTLLLSPNGPMGLYRLLAAYAEPPTFQPVAMLQAGAVPGRGLSDTLPLIDPSKGVESEVLRRRERRLLIKWVSESTPGLSSNAARKLLEDGRTEFNAGRTTQNWRRISRALSGMEPLKQFWARVQSWSCPPLTLAVAAGEVALLTWPCRTVAVLLLALAARMWVARAGLLPPQEGDGEGEGQGGGSAVAAAAGGEGCGDGGGGDGEVRGGRGKMATAAAVVSFLGEPPAMVEDIGNEPEAASAGAAAAGDAAATELLGVDGGAIGGGAIGGGIGMPSFPSVPPTPTAASAAAAAAAGGGGGGLAVAFSSPVPIPAPLSSATSAAPSVTVSMSSSAAGWIFGASPPTGVGGGAATAGEWAVHQQVLLQRGGAASGGGGSAEVPKDPLGALRQQYDHLVYFGLRVQNVLDDIAGGMERLQALMSWRNPVASGCFALGLVLMAVLLWIVGMRFVLGAVLLYDLRPPRWRDPWLPPPANAFAHLPTRADLMM